jgi:hypothetical protein
MSDQPDSSSAGPLHKTDAWPEMPEVRMLLSLRSHESRMRRRLALCGELCAALESLYRTAQALGASGLERENSGATGRVRKAPASAHTICSMVRDFGEALNRVGELVEFDLEAEAATPTLSVDSPVAPLVRKALFRAAEEHTRLKSWQEVASIGLSCDTRYRFAFQWSAAMECVQQTPQQATPALRPVVLLARRVADEVMALLDPLTGPIAEERATAYGITKKLRAQIEHIRSLVNRKCDTLEGEMRSVQTAIIKAQSQTMALVQNLAKIGGPAS